jgi:hypothetical protein
VVTVKNNLRDTVLVSRLNIYMYLIQDFKRLTLEEFVVTVSVKEKFNKLYNVNMN